MENSADLGECCNTFRDLQNSSYPTQLHSIIANYVTEMFRLNLNGAEAWPNSLIQWNPLMQSPKGQKNLAVLTEWPV